MTTTLTFTTDDVAPDRMAVLRHLGIPAEAEIPAHIDALHHAATEVFQETVAPAGILADISTVEFETVYRGEGLNEPASPVADIFPRSDHLALFTVTLGQALSDAIGECFAREDFALGSMLDALASEAADTAADQAERRFGEALRERGWSTPDGGVLRYSPGYCGWDVTGQKRLFRYLQPERIGVTLTESCLMQPLKSVSGVIIAGPKEIHRFPPTYTFCEQCETFACRDRLRELFAR